jgi:hypothetical protein
MNFRERQWHGVDGYPRRRCRIGFLFMGHDRSSVSCRSKFRHRLTICAMHYYLSAKSARIATHSATQRTKGCIAHDAVWGNPANFLQHWVTINRSHQRQLQANLAEPPMVLGGWL